ncbi:expressed unknown protein [Seminavis robusta]|uniref:Uncharacterized protein n=1 Tax=Seminavis robusta TaxID=568900 RepID=A0A9N8EEK2_9STRA|nr:expressed unknown protein [Seminavis robusta]|eukprot:Sro885_g216150.1 n/a (121) ;mRNA; r:37966-38421
MVEVSLSAMAWLCVLFIQVLVHIKVVYLRKRHDDDDHLTAAEGERLESETVDAANSETIEETLLTRSFSDPAMDDDFDDDDDPPNLKHRLSQTGSEMMSSCKSLEAIVQEYMNQEATLAQ